MALPTLNAEAGPSSLPPNPPAASPPPPPGTHPRRPPFRPSLPARPLLPPGWTTPLSHLVPFTLPSFLSAMKDIALHPERNSSLILRADARPAPTSPSTPGEHRDLVRLTAELDLEYVEEVRLRLMPKQPKRDERLDQRVVFYRSAQVEAKDSGRDGMDESEQDGREREGMDRSEKDQRESLGTQRGVVLMIPEVKRAEDVPFYHPPVRILAFIYEKVGEGQVDWAGADEGEQPVRGKIEVGYLPFPEEVGGARETPSMNGWAEQNPSTILNGVTSASSTTATEFIMDRLTLSSPRKPKRRSPLAGPSVDANEEPFARAEGPIVNGELGPTDSQVEPGNATDNTAFTERLERTCQVLLERVYKQGHGTMIGYKKRVEHDVIVPRESFQDLYLVLKERHRHLDSRVAKPGRTLLEDVKRHVWKPSDASLPSDPLLPSDLSGWGSQDVAIAAFLMLLWRDMYPPRVEGARDLGAGQMWESWGRPPSGFVDLGCGNGLLVHILTSEGYRGNGYELRSRRTWPLYPPDTRAALHELPIDPPSWFPDTIEQWRSSTWPSEDLCAIKEGTFLIGNHADELTPWLPLLSLLPQTPIPYLSLPCCLHTLDSLFTHLSFAPASHPYSPEGNFETGLEPGQSRYKAYLMWLGWMGLKCGWKWEKEGLRIPSTKGWGIVARDRWTAGEEDWECRDWVLDEVRKVREKGLWKIRETEGKDH